jgi:hypothetical protein
MSKTPEELADRIERQAILYVSLLAKNDREYFATKRAYIAGYEEAEARHEAYILAAEKNFKRLQAKLDHFANADKVINSPEKPDGCNSSNNSNGWISVKDRLPEDGENYLVLFRVRGDKHSPFQFEITWFDNTWDFPSTLEVTHYLPLPAAPKEAP